MEEMPAGAMDPAEGRSWCSGELWFWTSNQRYATRILRKQCFFSTFCFQHQSWKVKETTSASAKFKRGLLCSSGKKCDFLVIYVCLALELAQEMFSLLFSRLLGLTWQLEQLHWELVFHLRLQSCNFNQRSLPGMKQKRLLLTQNSQQTHPLFIRLRWPAPFRVVSLDLIILYRRQSEGKSILKVHAGL